MFSLVYASGVEHKPVFLGLFESHERSVEFLLGYLKETVGEELKTAEELEERAGKAWNFAIAPFQKAAKAAKLETSNLVICEGTTNKGTPCKKRAKKGERFCSYHATKVSSDTDSAPEEKKEAPKRKSSGTLCTAMTKKNTNCKKYARPGSLLCAAHSAAAEKEQKTCERAKSNSDEEIESLFTSYLFDESDTDSPDEIQIVEGIVIQARANTLSLMPGLNAPRERNSKVIVYTRDNMQLIRSVKNEKILYLLKSKDEGLFSADDIFYAMEHIPEYKGAKNKELVYFIGTRKFPQIRLLDGVLQEKFAELGQDEVKVKELVEEYLKKYKMEDLVRWVLPGGFDLKKYV